MDALVDTLEKNARERKIPIMEKEGIEFLTQYIKNHHIQTILEIGTAVGYSAIKMALVSKQIQITTIERDPIRYEEAKKNIQMIGLQDQIHVICSDAFDVTTKDHFDLIFIDAAKSQYTKFFERFQAQLREKGTIITDNINFHGLTHSKEPIESKNVRGIVRKLNEYIAFLKEHSEFDTTFYDIGDGIAVSVKKS